MTIDLIRHSSLPWARILSVRNLESKRFDLALGLLLAFGVFLLYWQSLVPSVLDGDQGEFQYMPAVLGIPHPTGFPLYILLGHLWAIMPLGTLAYRMNLFSAFLGALTIAALFFSLRAQRLYILAAAGASLTLALVPQFWEFSTAAAVYRLHDLLVVLVFGFLAEWEMHKDPRWLELAALAFGLDLANHLTIVFLAPATLVLLLTAGGRGFFRQARLILKCTLLLFLPLILYAYIPIRGMQLVTNNFTLPNLNQAMSQGIVSAFYNNSPSGLFQYLVGASFFKSVTGNWQWKWDTLIPDWTTILLQTVNWQALLMSLLGVVILAVRRIRLALWLGISVLTYQILALQYSYEGLADIGQFSSYFREYYLPSFVGIIIFFAWGIDGFLRGFGALAKRMGLRSFAAIAVAQVSLIAAFLIITGSDLYFHRSNSLIDRSTEIQAKWENIRRYPPLQDAALVGHWGDLTPLWYYQYAEGWRRDLVTLNPPDESQVAAWLATGKPLYIAGSLLDWAPGIAKNYHLTPWGPLVRVSADNLVLSSPLPNAGNWTLAGDRPLLKVSGYQVSRSSLPVGENLSVGIFWQVLNPVPIDNVALYISLVTDQNSTRPRSYPLVVNWLPGRRLTLGQSALGTYTFPVPWGTLPGNYRLSLTGYLIKGGSTLSIMDGNSAVTSVELGTIRVEPASSYPSSAVTDHPANVDFGGRVTLLGWDGSLGQKTAGDTAVLQMFWKGGGHTQDDLIASLSLENSRIKRPIGDQALAAGYSVTNWRDGEIVQGTRPITLPADLADGEYDLVLRVRDASLDTPLDLHEGWIPRGDNYVLGRVQVTGRKHSYVAPDVANPQVANFDNRIRMLGYSSDSIQIRPGDSVHFQLYWEALGLMNASYKFFVHVVDGNGNLITQHDDIPGDGSLPTTGWLPNEIVTDTFDLTLPPDTPPGAYQIQVGFYDSIKGQRLNVIDESGAPKDNVYLQSGLEVMAK